MRNVVNNPEFLSVHKKMANLLDSILVAEKDAHLIPKYTLGEISKNSTPYKFAQNTKFYPFSSVYEMAKLCGDKNAPANLFIDSLDSKNQFIRYWSAVALKSKTHLEPSAAKTLLEKMQDEPYPPAQIELAGLVYKHYHHDYAKNVLVKYALDKNHFLSLQSLQNIHFQDKSRLLPFLSLIKQVKSLKKSQNEIQSLGDVLLYRAEGKPLYYERYW
jgi:uncharacterized sulfatase